MATSEVLKEEFLTCIVCHEIFREPVTLHCGHTFCSQCITAYTKTQQDAVAQQSISCPHCRGLTKVPDPQRSVEEWAGQIKTGFFVKGLVEKFTGEPEEDEDIFCSLCDDSSKIAVVHCKQCKEEMCEACRGSHEKLFKKHTICSPSEVVRGTRTKREDVCVEHTGFRIDMFCVDCDQALCQRCCIVHHRKCESIITLQQAVPRFDVALENMSHDLTIQKNDTTLQVTKLKMQSEKLDERSQEAEVSISRTSERVVHVIREAERQLKENVKQAREEGLQRLQQEVKRGETRLEEIDQRSGLVKQALHSDVDMDHFEMYSAVKPKKMEHPPEDKEPRDKVIDIEYDNTASDQVMSLLESEGLGKLKFMYDEESEKAEQVPKGRKGLNLKEATINKVPKEFKLLNTLNTWEHGITSIAVMSVGDLTVIVCSYEKYIKAFYYIDTALKQSCIYFGDEGSGSARLSKCNEVDGVCLFSKRKLIFFQVQPDLNRTGSATTQRDYADIQSISSTHFAAAAYVTYERYIDVIDHHGIIIRTFAVNVKPSQYVCVNNCIIFGKQDDNSITSITDHGEEVFTAHPLNSIKLDENQNIQLADLCLWDEENILTLHVVEHPSKDLLGHTIHVPKLLEVSLVTRNGKYVRSVLRSVESALLEEYARSRIASDNFGHIYLTSKSTIYKYGCK